MAKTDSKEIFETLSVPRAVREMALPTIFGQIIILIYNMADTFYIGRTDDPYMVAAASLILPIFNICLALAGLTGTGGGALISRLLGEGRAHDAKKVSSFSLYLSIVITALFSLTMLAFMEPILKVLGASGNTFLYARQYAMCVIVLGGVPTVLSNVMSNLLRSVGASGKAGFGITMGGIINIIIDPLFMFVLLPRGHEVLGAGLATLLSNCIVCTYFFAVIYKLRGQSVISFSIKCGLPDKKYIGSILNVGMPAAIATLLFDLDYVIIDKMMASYGDIALASIGIVLKAERLPLNVGIGLCQGMLPLVAYSFAARNKKRMDAVIKYTLKVGLIVGVLSIIMYEICAGYILRFFIDDAGTVELGTEFLRIRCLATPLMFMSFFTVNVFQGFGKGNTALFLGLMRWLAFNIPMLFVMNHFVGMYGVAWSQVTGDILTVALSFFVYVRYTRRIAAEEGGLEPDGRSGS